MAEEKIAGYKESEFPDFFYAPYIPLFVTEIYGEKKKTGVKQWFRILKLRFYRWCGFKLTSDERSEIAFWITRNVKD